MIDLLSNFLGLIIMLIISYGDWRIKKIKIRNDHLKHLEST